MRHTKHLATALFALSLLLASAPLHAQVSLPASGIINTIAGYGTAGNSGNGGQALSAELDNPNGIAVDPNNGTIYISDSANNLVKAINPTTGVISIYAGGGWFSNPSGYPLIVGDGGPATSAMLQNPAGLAVDKYSNLYIADAYDNRVRMVTPSGTISTLAGDGVPGYQGDNQAADINSQLDMPMSVAIDPTTGNLYIADYENNRIRKMTAGSNGMVSGSSIITTAVSPSYVLAPEGVAADAFGNIYIADTGHQRIIRLTGSALFYAAGNGTAGYAGDQGQATNAELNTPMGVAVDSFGNLYIADTGNQRIREVPNPTFSTASIYTVAGNGTAGFTGDGGSAKLAEFGKAGLTGVYGIALDSHNNLYLADGDNNRVRAVGAFAYGLPAHGIITTIAGNGTAGYSGDGGAAISGELHTPWGVSVDPYDNVYIADANNVAIRAIASSTGNILTLAATGLGGDGVAADPYGDFFVANTGYNRVLAGIPGSSSYNIYLWAGNTNGTVGYSGDGGTAPNALLHGPQGAAVDSSDNVYIADTINNRIRKVTESTDDISTIAGNGTAGYSGDGNTATNAELNNPYGVAVDSSGNIYIADTYNNRIRKVTASTQQISTVAGNGTAGYSGDGGAATNAEVYLPTGVAVDSSGNIYIADYGNNRVRMVTVSTGAISTIAGNGTAGYTGDGAAATSAELNRPAGVAVDAKGNIFIADSSNNRIRVVGH
ncbi:MAG: NHL repeat-containing protein [Terracidiphilus sp.]